jgi:hypothetical protein
MPFDNAKEKGEALGHFRKLNVHRWSNYPEVNDAVSTIYEDLKNDPNFVGHERLNRRHIKIVVLDLYVNWCSDPSRFIAYGRASDYYVARSRYNKLHISYKIVPVIDALEIRGWIEHHGGFYDTEWEVGRLSRMRATKALITLIRDKHAIPIDVIEIHHSVESIILRDKINNAKGIKKKINLEYKDTPYTVRIRGLLNRYNKLLRRTKIEIPNAPPEGIPSTSKKKFTKITIDPMDKYVRRIFSNGSWEDGGRFHGGWWQRISSDWRVQISLDGKNKGATEIDYSGLHIVLLYAIEGIDYWNTDGRDTYLIDNVEQSERMRSLLKLVLLISINAKSKRSALGAIRGKIAEHPDEYNWTNEENVPLSDIINAFMERHEPIRKYFYSNSGIKLQRIDSDIAEKVIKHFTNLNIPTLCIHDSFVITHAYADELKREMFKAASEVINKMNKGRLKIEIRIKSKTYIDII